MSKISIAGATTGTGTFTLASPATDTDRVLTLPDEAGTVVTTGSTGVVTSAMLTGDAVPLGVGQTWTDVTGSRATGTTYTNSTGRPIMVAATAGSATYSYCFGVVDGVTIIESQSRDSATTTSQASATFIVPAGSTYQVNVNVNGSSTSFTNWQELR